LADPLRNCSHGFTVMTFTLHYRLCATYADDQMIEAAAEPCVMYEWCCADVQDQVQEGITESSTVGAAAAEAALPTCHFCGGGRAGPMCRTGLLTAEMRWTD